MDWMGVAGPAKLENSRDDWRDMERCISLSPSTHSAATLRAQGLRISLPCLDGGWFGVVGFPPPAARSRVLIYKLDCCPINVQSEHPPQQPQALKAVGARQKRTSLSLITSSLSHVVTQSLIDHFPNNNLAHVTTLQAENHMGQGQV